jgi:hypothetical protein
MTTLYADEVIAAIRRFPQNDPIAGFSQGAYCLPQNSMGQGWTVRVDQTNCFIPLQKQVLGGVKEPLP